jgi:hypothetical protein
MKKNQQQYWQTAIENMNSNNQLELAELLVEELSSHENLVNDTYNVEKSVQLREVLEKFLSQLNTNKKSDKYVHALEAFTSLGLKYQKEIVAAFCKETLDQLEEAKKDAKVLQCEQNGHVLGEWVKKTRENLEGYKYRVSPFDYNEFKDSLEYSLKNRYGGGTFVQEYTRSWSKEKHYTTSVDLINQKGDIYWLPYEVIWERTCECGTNKETVNREPEEIKEKRLAEEKKEKIKRLRAQIRELEKDKE